MASTGSGQFASDRRRRWNRRASWTFLCGTLAVAATGVPALASAASVRPLVSTADIAGLGTVLVTGNHPLYVTTNDTGGRSTCTGACARVWIPLVASSTSSHHLGHLRGLGTIHRTGGRRQVAIDGRPLYFLRSDHTVASASGQGVVNAWFTVHPNGSIARAAVAGPVPTTTAPPASSTTSPAAVVPPASGSRSVPPSTPPPAAPSPTSTPPTSPPPTTTSPPPTTTTTSAPSGGGVSF